MIKSKSSASSIVVPSIFVQINGAKLLNAARVSVSPKSNINIYKNVRIVVIRL